MGKLLLGRLGAAVPVLAIMTVLTFVLVSLIPGDAATTILGQDATPERVEALNAELGLDQPLFAQYWQWLQAALGGNLGTSLYTGDAVAHVVSTRVVPTLVIVGTSTVLAVVIGTFTGFLAALKGGWLARTLDTLGMVGIALPNFWIALLLVAILAGRLSLFPALGYAHFRQGPVDWAAHLVLPIASLTVAGIAMVAKQSRDAISEALSRDFVRFLDGNGMSRRRLLWSHVLRHAAGRIVAVALATFINLFGGTVALEAVFAIPGLGSLVATATLQHDLPTVQGAVLAYTIVILVMTILADLTRAHLDPKVRAHR